MNLQPPDAEDPRDDEGKLIDALKEIARGAATRTDTAPYEEYQPTPEKARDWEPHAWVIDALLAAYTMGEQNATRAASFVTNAIEETYRDRESQLVASSGLAILEQSGLTEVELDLNKAMTVHDRKVVHFIKTGDMKVKLVMENKQ